MIFVRVLAPAEQREILLAEFVDSPTQGIVERDLPDDQVELRVFFPSLETAALWRDRLRRFEPELREEEDEDWLALWRETWHPMTVGERFFLVPAWMDDPTPDGRIRLTMHAGLAFGTGEHATTQLCLSALERYLEPGSTAIDMGTGTGILAIAAARLGARRVAAVDSDPAALEVARECLDGLDLPVDLVLASSFCFRVACAGAVVMNIAADPAIEMAGELARVIAPVGTAILSGFMNDQAEAVQQACRAAGLDLLETASQGEWSSLVARKPG